MMLLEGKVAFITGSAAQTALLGFTRNLAVEVGQYTITVNIVSPGVTLTAEVRARLSPEEQERRAQQTPPTHRHGGGHCQCRPVPGL